MGKSSINGPFPMAMLNNQRVHDDALVHPPNLHRPELWTSEGPSYTSQTTGDFPGKAIYSPCSSMIYRFQKCWLSRRFNYQRLDPTKSYIPYHSFIPLHPYCYILPYEHPLKKNTDPYRSTSPLKPSELIHRSKRRSHRPERCARFGCDPVRRCSDCSRDTWPLPRQKKGRKWWNRWR